MTWRSDASAHTFRSITLMQKHHQTWRSDASVPVTFDCAARCRPAGGSKPFTGAATCHTRLYHEEGYLFFARSVKKSKLLIISAHSHKNSNFFFKPNHIIEYRGSGAHRYRLLAPKCKGLDPGALKNKNTRHTQGGAELALARSCLNWHWRVGV